VARRSVKGAACVPLGAEGGRCQCRGKFVRSCSSYVYAREATWGVSPSRSSCTTWSHASPGHLGGIGEASWSQARFRTRDQIEWESYPECAEGRAALDQSNWQGNKSGRIGRSRRNVSSASGLQRKHRMENGQLTTGRPTLVSPSWDNGAWHMPGGKRGGCRSWNEREASMVGEGHLQGSNLESPARCLCGQHARGLIVY